MILVTGGSGYLGSHIVRRLVETGESVRVLIRDEERARRENRLRGLQVDWIRGDVTQPATLNAAVEKVDAIVHTVAIAIEKGRGTYEQINHQGTVNLVEAAQAAGVRRFVNMSQLGAAPDLPYRFLASKGRAQEFVAQSELDWTALRPSTIWGPEDEFANAFARLIPLTPFIFPLIGGEDARFEPIWVGDVVTTVLKVLPDPSTYKKEYEIGGPEVLTLEQIEKRTLQAIEARRLLIPVPMAFLKIFVGLMEWGLPNPPVTRSLLELLGVRNVTTVNAIGEFVSNPRPFTPENTAPYMRSFRRMDTLRQFLGS